MARFASTHALDRVLVAVPHSVTGRAVTGGARLVGAGLLVSIGLIHLSLAPLYSQASAFVGLSFYAAFAASLVAAVGVVAGLRGAWVFGGLVSAGALLALAASITIGFFGFMDSLDAPWATLSLRLEAAFVGLYLVLAAIRRNVFLAPAPTAARAR